MTTTAAPPDTYDVLASAYDTIIAGYDHDRWLRAIEALAETYGLTGRRVLDVACGTGASFVPLLDRGYEVVGCDLSLGMLERARERLDGRAVALHQADMRSLPRLGAFDLVLCLDDAINHLLEPGDVAATFRGVARNLRPGGLFVFDVNTLHALRAGFSEAWEWQDAVRSVGWQGLGAADLPAGGAAAARLVIREGADLHETVLRERHHPVERLVAHLEAAGLDVLATHGQRRGVTITPAVDEASDDKALVFARRAG